MINYKKILTEILQNLQQDRYKAKNNRKVSFKEYCSLKDYQRYHLGDEDIIVTPVLLSILEILGYRSSINILQQVEEKGDKPDFRTLKTNLFVLDAKSTNSDISHKGNTLKTPYNQISRYLINLKGYNYGILFNLIKFELFNRIYEPDGTIKVVLLKDKTLNLLKLLELFESKEIDGSKDFDNFKWFVDTFLFREISKNEYITLIKERKIEELIVPDKDFLREIVYNLINKIRREVKRQIDDFDVDSDEMLRLNHELQNIAGELNITAGEDVRSIVLEEFIKQASYVVLLKLVLIRILEDNNLIEKNLYNGGFKIKLEPPLNYTLHKLLYEAKYQASNFYPYFYDGTPFDFQIEDEELFIEALFELSKINFAEIDFDLIGDLYEHYLNTEDRKDKGQYYTPHFIVELILNRVGFNIHKSRKIEKKMFLDPACGSGGFLVEIARRFRLAGNNKEVEAKRAIVDCVNGIELTPFASFLAEINVIIQILPLVKRIDNPKYKKISSLKIFRQDSLFSVYNRNEFNGEEYVRVQKSHVLAGDKELKFELLVNGNDFDYVVGNPPYVGEKGHKELFEPLKEHEYWKHFYQGRSDYLYYFIILGISKLKEGGKLGLITTQYWLTADSASSLRNYILEKAKIVEIIDFKGIKLFPEAKGQENIIIILEKCENEDERLNNQVKIIQFNKDWVLEQKKYVDSSGSVVTNYKRWIDLLTHSNQFNLFSDVTKTGFTFGKDKRETIADIYYSVYVQGELDENAWYLYSKERESFEYDNFNKLVDLFNVNQGIVSGADKITRENIKKIPGSEVKSKNIEINDPIFIFNEEKLSKYNFDQNEISFIKKFYKNSDIKKGFVDLSSEQFVIYTQDIEKIEKYKNLKNHFDKYKSLLLERREVKNGRIRWFDLWWSRDKQIFENEKLVTSRRSKQNRFAYENLKRYPQSDITIITKKEGTQENLKYLLALLNSSLLNEWYGKNTKLKGDMREFYYTPLSKVPIKKIDFKDKDEKYVHDILGGIYSSTQSEKKSHKFDSISNTWIKSKGLIDYYMEIKKELYELQKNGFIFDPESVITNKNMIKVDFIILCSSEITKHIKKEIVEDISFFETVLGKNKDISELNSIEKETFNRLTNNCEFYFKLASKDFIIKGVTSSNSDSLFPDETELKEYGFNFIIILKTEDNGKLIIEVKDRAKAQELTDRINDLLSKKPRINWGDIKNIPFSNTELEKFVENKKEYIYQALSQVNNKVEKRLKEIFEKNETKAIAKIKNSNYLQTLIDYYVDWLYKKSS